MDSLSTPVTKILYYLPFTIIYEVQRNKSCYLSNKPLVRSDLQQEGGLPNTVP